MTAQRQRRMLLLLLCSCILFAFARSGAASPVRVAAGGSALQAGADAPVPVRHPVAPAPTARARRVGSSAGAWYLPAVVRAPAAATPTTTPTATGSATATPTATPTQPAAELTPLPPGPVTLVTLGDSLTAGDGDDSTGGGFPARLNSYLQVRRPGSTVENLGRSGWTSADVIDGTGGEEGQLAQAVSVLSGGNDARVATVWIGSNDLWYLYEYGPEPMTAEAEDADLAAYTAHLERIVADLRGTGAAVLVGLMDDQAQRPVVAAPPNPDEPAFPSITADDRARMTLQVQRYNDALRTVAGGRGAQLVDFYHTDIFTNPATLAEDGNHPNGAGYDVIAGLWEGVLGALVGE